MFEGTLLVVVDRQKLIFQNCYDQRIENRESICTQVLQIRHNSCKDDLTPFSQVSFSLLLFSISLDM